MGIEATHYDTVYTYQQDDNSRYRSSNFPAGNHFTQGPGGRRYIEIHPLESEKSIEIAIKDFPYLKLGKQDQTEHYDQYGQNMVNENVFLNPTIYVDTNPSYQLINMQTQQHDKHI